MKTLRSLGEEHLIQLIREIVLDPERADSHFQLKDDVSFLAEESLVLTADHLVEGVHFRRETFSAEDLAHKALAVNLSDLASKGAKPVGFLLSIALPADLSEEWMRGFANSLRQAADRWGISLLGGDTSSSPQSIFISITAFGRGIAPLKIRSRAQAGDLVVVTGHLGDSAVGLEILEKKLDRHPGAEKLLARHRRPEPRLSEGEWLASREEVRAMMDLSDGLWTDLEKMAHAAGLKARVETEKIPTSRELETWASQQKEPSAKWSVFGGEDYELLLAVKPEVFNALKGEFERRWSLPLTAVGEFQKGPPGHIQWIGSVDLRGYAPFRHFE